MAINDMVTQVHALNEAFKNGDGFTDQKQGHAAIDDLKKITTFPSHRSQIGERG
jgi:hypothetical protein